MSTTNPFSPRPSRPARHRHALVLALLATISLSACGGADEDGDQAAGATEASTPAPSPSPSPTSGRPGRRRLGRHADPDHLRRYAAHREAARQRHGTRSRRPAAADAHLPRPQQRREDRAASPRALARRCPRRARSRRRRHRLLGARRRLGLLLRQRRPVLQRHRAHRRARRRPASARAPKRGLQGHDRTSGMTYRGHCLQTQARPDWRGPRRCCQFRPLGLTGRRDLSRWPRPRAECGRPAASAAGGGKGHRTTGTAKRPRRRDRSRPAQAIRGLPLPRANIVPTVHDGGICYLVSMPALRLPRDPPTSR